MELFTNIDEVEFAEARPGQIPNFTLAPLPDMIGENLQQKLRDAAKFICWWLDPYWVNKGKPKQHLRFTMENHSTDLINFTDMDVTRPMQRDFVVFMNLARQFQPREMFRAHRFVLIDDLDDPEELPTGGATTGQNHMNLGYIQFHPPVFLPEAREIPGVSRFLGTLIHEYGHSFFTHNIIPQYSKEEIRARWMNQFGWTDDKTTIYPERCISGYAASAADEDYCDSLVGAVLRPDLLDVEKNDVLNQTVLRTLIPNRLSVATVKEVTEPVSGKNPLIYRIRALGEPTPLFRFP